MELLVAMLILSIVLALFYSVWGMGIKFTKRSQELAQKYMEARVFINFLEKELRSAVPFNFPGYVDFEWDADKKRLAFWQTAVDVPRIVEPHPFFIHRNTYYLKEENGKNILYKEVKPLFPGDFEVLLGPALKGDIDLKIDWGKDKIRPPLPEKVEVSIIFEDGEQLKKDVYINALRKPKK
jgi:hypothetical protein